MKRFIHVSTRAVFLAAVFVITVVPMARAVFDDLAPNPRALARGQALTAVGDDAWSYYYNPALLPHLTLFNGGVSTVRP